MKVTIFLKVWIALIVLTIVSALVANSNFEYASTSILLLATIKFIGIAFYFMGLKKAHAFWKASIFIYLILFVVLSISIL